jgi:hypothetical protein
MAAISDIVPLSTSFSQSRPQYSITDERQIAKYQPWTAETSSEVPLVSNSKTE